MSSLPFRLFAALAFVVVAVVSRAQTYPPAWSNTKTYAVGDQVQVLGNVVRAVKPSTVAGKFIYANWELWEVRANTTVMVGTGQTFSTLESAWAYGQNARVAEGAYLHFYISTTHGGYFGENIHGLVLDHESGARVSIIGDNPSSIRIGAPAGFGANAFIIDSGHSFGTISNVSLGGNGFANTGSGIYATANACISDVSGVVISGFQDGVLADQGASITLENNVQISSAEQYMVVASHNANILVKNGWTSNGASNGFFWATFGGQITAQSCTLTNSSGSGAYAEHGGQIDVSGSSISQCTVGVNAFDRGYVYAQNCVLSGNTYCDLQAMTGSLIYAAGTGTTNNITDTGTGSYIS